MMKQVVNLYGNITHFLNDIEKKENVINEYESQKGGSQDWYGTSSYGEAKNLLQYGWTEPLEDFKKSYQLASKTEVKRKLCTNVVGFAPCVPNAIIGLPNNMYTKKRTVNKTRTATFIYAPVLASRHRTSDFINAGKKLLTIVGEMEKQGIRINLYATPMAMKINEKYLLNVVKLKEANQSIEIKKLCFPLVHPSFARRFGFRSIETNEKFWKMLTATEKRTLKNSYGRPMNEVEIKNTITNSTLKKAVVLTAKTLNEFEIDELLKIIEGQIKAHFQTA